MRKIDTGLDDQNQINALDIILQMKCYKKKKKNYLLQCIAQTKFGSEGLGFSRSTCSRRHKPWLFHCITQELAGSS